MGYPAVVREIKRMIEDTSLANPMAREIVRKSGYRPGETEGVPNPRPRTIIDGIIDPLEAHNARLFKVDLTAATEIRFTCEANVTMFLNRATGTDTNAIDTTWEVLTGLNSSNASVNISASRTTTLAGDLNWLTIPEAQRVPMTLGMGHSANVVELDPNRLDRSFAFAVQVR